MSGGPLDDIPGLLARGEASSRELTLACLARIETVDRGRLGATFAVMADSALVEADAADRARARGLLLGPLHGVPVGVKDNIDVAGVPTTVGMSFFLDAVATRDAACVARLRSAGAVVLAKLALHECAFGVTGVNRHVHDCRNAWDLERIPGGSSAGSAAAVAADLVPLALGTDTGGSVRIPAALNGVTALRATPGRIPLDGVFPVSWTYDTVGPLARSAAECALAAAALYDPGGEDPRTLLDAGVRGLRVAVPRWFLEAGTDDAVAAATEAVADALSAQGAVRVEVDVPGLAEAHRVMRTLVQAEAYAVHRRRLAEAPERFGEDVRRRLLLGATISGADYACARDEARRFAHGVRRLLAGGGPGVATGRGPGVATGGIDLLVAPATGTTAPLVAESETVATTDRLTRHTYAWSLAGLPTVAVPAGLAADGLPVGAQIAAAPARDALALAAAVAWQRASGWHLRRPPAPVSTPASR